MATTKASTPIFSSDRRQDEALDCPFSSSYEPMPSTSPPPAKAEPSRLKERRGAGSTKRHLEAGGCRSKASDLSSDRVDKAMPAAFKIKAWGGGWPSHPIHWKREIDLSPSLSSDLPGSEPPIKPPDPYSSESNPSLSSACLYRPTAS